MSKSFIMTVNTASQSVNANGSVDFGNIARKFGCNLNLVNDSIKTSGDGYYTYLLNIVVAPTETGDFSVTLYDNGNAIDGATATESVATEGSLITLTVPTAIRIKCGCCEIDHNITCRLSGSATVSNVVLLGEKK